MSLLKLKKSSVPGKIPQASDLEYGELALNYADGVIFYKKADNTISTIGGGTSGGSGSGSGATTYIKKAANYTALDKDNILADTSGGSFTITLPANPTLGMQVLIADSSDWQSQSLIVGRNGATIEGLAQDMVLDVSGVSVQFIYSGTTWEVFTQTGIIGAGAATQTFSRTTFIATNLQTTFPAIYRPNLPNLLEVYVNGVLLSTNDYTATNGSTVVLNNGVPAGTVVDIKVYAVLQYGQVAWDNVTDKPAFFSGSYTDLTNKPALGTAAATDSSAYATAAQGIKADTAVQPSSLATVATTGNYGDLTNKPILGTAAATNSTAYATAAQGTKADTAVQPGSLATVATTGNYGDLLNKPTLGTAAATNSTAYATAAQGTKADTAVQPSSLATVATSGSYTDLLNKPTIPSITGLATETFVTTKITDLINGAPAALDTLKEISDRLATDESVVTALVNTVSTKANTSSLSTVATTGSYTDLLNKPTLFSGSYTDLTNKPVLFSGSYTDLTNKPSLFSGSYTDLTNKPTLGTAAATNVTAYATALQGSKADTAVQPGNLATVATSGNYNDLINKPTSGGITYIVKTAEYVAKDKEGILADTSAGGFPILMPANPAVGAQVFIADKGNWAVNPITIAGNGSTIDGSSTSRTISTGDVSVQCIYDGTTWKVFTFPNITDSGAGTVSDIFVRNTFVSPFPQTTIKTIYTPGQLEVYINGVLIPRTEYAATNGTSIIFNTTLPADTVVDVKKYSSFSLFNRTTFTASTNQTVFNYLSYIPGLLEVFVNGVMLSSGDYLASSGINVIFNQGLPAGSVVEFKAYTGGSTFSNNVFTAYGDQTIFQVQHVKELTEVYINGILISPDDYWSYNNTIEFVSPLRAGTLVYIKKFSRLPYGELDWTNITSKPALFSGSYTDLTNKPVLFSGSYTDLTNKPDIPSITGLASETFVTTQINNLINGAPGTLDTLKEIADRLATDESAVSVITTTLATKANTSSLSTVATTGSYTDLLNKPTLFSGSYIDLTNKPTLSTVASTGSYTDLTNKPTLFSGSYIDLANKPTFATVATTGSYNDLTNKPVIGDALPAQTGNAGKYLKTDGTTASWEPITSPQATFVRTSFVATANQTTFSATYSVGLLEVFVNGLLIPSSDYVASNGTSVVFTQGLLADSLVDIKSYSAYSTSLLQVDWSTIQNKPTTLSAFTNDLGYLTSVSANALTGTVLKSTILTSSLTSVGTLTGLTTSDKISVTYTPGTTVGYALNLTGKDTQGGVGYFDFLKLTNTTTGATNPNKSFRLNNTGNLEIINSAYTANLFELTDSGILNLPSGILKVAGKQAVNGPAFSVYQNTAQSIPTDVLTKLNWNVEEYDTNNNFASNRFTPTVEGYYTFTAAVRLDSGVGTGERMIVIYKNGSEYKRGYNTKGTASVGDSWMQMEITCQGYANGSTDYYEVYVQHGAGASRSTTGNLQFTYFQGCMLRGA